MSAPTVQPAVHQHIITALVENETGTLNRVTSLFRRRAFSLASLNAGDCEIPGFSRLTFVVNGDDFVLSQVLRQLEKLLDVVECDDIPPAVALERELMLIRVKASGEAQAQARTEAIARGAREIHASANAVTFELSDTPDGLEAMVQAMQAFGVEEIVRSGMLAMRKDG